VKKFLLFLLCFFCLVAIFVYLFPKPILTPVADILIADEPIEHADAIVVLNTGIGIYERLLEAANLYNQDYADRIFINGNRKNDLLRTLEKQGLQHCCAWEEEWTRVLVFSGVPRQAITAIPAEDAYDTITEAQSIGPQIISSGINKLIITTSKTHTARALYIWRELFGNRLQITCAAAQKDEFTPDGWWKEGEQIKTVLYEYGSWLYFWIRAIPI
jgi:uncharacterized SAM-binding protein YcdF (DUF218 family)